jgi:CheY-like chemotaxis protein
MKTILAIDDDECIRISLKKYFSARGHKIVVMKDGLEGVLAFNNGYDFNIVITDIDLPKLNGNEVATYIKNSTKGSIPIIAITGGGRDIIQRELFDSVLIKPIKLETLANTIDIYP